MKIIHLCTGFPISFNGGITNYVRSIAETQKKNGMDVTVISAPTSEKFSFNVVKYKNFYIRPFTFRYRKSFFGYKKIKKILKKEKPDLLHIHMMLDVDCRLWKILKKYNIKYVISLHDYSFLCPRIQMYRNNMNCEKVGDNCSKCASVIEQTFLINKLFKCLHLDNTKGKKKSPNFIKMYNYNKKLLENANCLIPVSNRVMEIYKNSDIDGVYKVLHIGNITAEKFKPYVKNEKRDNIIKILMLGNFSQLKGGPEFIKIVNSLSQDKFKFYFLGRCTNEEEKLMKENNIVNKGSYKQIDLPNLLKEYDFGCVLSVWEDNGPQVVMELLNNNIPVIGTKMGGIPDFVHDGENGFLYNPYSKESFDSLILKLQNLTILDVENMKERISRTTTPEEHYKQLNEIYERILNK